MSELKAKLLELKTKSKILDIEGLKVEIREMDAGAAAEYENSLYKVVGGKVIYQTEGTKPKLVMLTTYDEEGNRVFDTKDLKQVNLLPANVVNKIFDAAVELNGLDPEKAAKN